MLRSGRPLLSSTVTSISVRNASPRPCHFWWASRQDVDETVRSTFSRWFHHQIYLHNFGCWASCCALISIQMIQFRLWTWSIRLHVLCRQSIFHIPYLHPPEEYKLSLGKETIHGMATLRLTVLTQIDSFHEFLIGAASHEFKWDRNTLACVRIPLLGTVHAYICILGYT